MEEWIILLLILIAILWHQSMKARERALEIARQTSRDMDSQLLDQTVAIASIGLKRDGAGQLRIR